MSSPPSSSSSSSYNSSLLVIATLLAFVFIFTIAIHLVLRLLACLSSSAAASSPNSAASSMLVSSASHLDPNRKELIDSLPLYSLTSLPRCPSAKHCTICLSPFSPDDKIRLLPPCRHTFHSPCIDAWLKSSLSCPLCRSSVQYVQNSAPLTPEPQQQQQQQQQQPAAEETARVSSWLKEYVDRLALSASSSFNSMRFSSASFGSTIFSAWGSQRFDGGGSPAGSLELGESFRSEESGYFASSYKWMMAAGAASQDSSSLR